MLRALPAALRPPPEHAGAVVEVAEALPEAVLLLQVEVRDEARRVVAAGSQALGERVKARADERARLPPVLELLVEHVRIETRHERGQRVQRLRGLGDRRLEDRAAAGEDGKVRCRRPLVAVELEMVVTERVDRDQDQVRGARRGAPLGQRRILLRRTERRPWHSRRPPAGEEHRHDARRDEEADEDAPYPPPRHEPRQQSGRDADAEAAQRANCRPPEDEPDALAPVEHREVDPHHRGHGEGRAERSERGGRDGDAGCEAPADPPRDGHRTQSWTALRPSSRAADARWNLRARRARGRAQRAGSEDGLRPTGRGARAPR